MSSPAPADPSTSPVFPSEAPPASLAGLGLLPYSSIDPGRPWLLTGIGITSIVIASISMLMALLAGLMYTPWIIMTMSPGGFAGPGGPTPVPGAGPATTAANTLSQADADLIVAALSARQPMAPADQAALAQALQLAETPIAPPPDGQWTAAHVTQQLSYTQSWNDGTTSTTSFTFAAGGDLSLSGGTININLWRPNGDWSSTTVSNGAVTGTSTTSGTATWTPGIQVPSRASVVVMLVSLALSLGLAVLLLVAGIQTLRGMPSGRTLHLWWAPAKLVAALLAAAASYYFWTRTFFGGFGVGSDDAQGALLVSIGWLVVALIWPVTVIALLLGARSLREYYADASSPHVYQGAVARHAPLRPMR